MSRGTNESETQTLKTVKIALFLILWIAAGLLLLVRTMAPAAGKGAPVDKINLDQAVLKEKIPSSFAQPSRPYLPPKRPAIGETDYMNVAEMPLFKLDFTPENWQLITAPIEVMKEQSAQLEKDKIWVPCTFTAEGETYQARCRIRGILPNHWQHESYKSWRIKFAKDHLFRGMRMVNFIIMPDRAYYMEAFGNHLMRGKGMLAFRDGFARIDLNGSGSWHPYYMAEAPTAEFLEANGRPASAVFRRIDTGQETRFYKKKIYYGVGRNFEENFKNYIKNPAKEPLFRAALGRIINYKDFGELSQVVDVERFANLHALSVVVGIHHALNMNNIYYYYDDTTGLFEPIMWDLHALPLQETVAMGIDLGPQQHIPLLFKNLLASDEYRYLRDRAIWSWVADEGKGLLGLYDTIHEGVWPWLEQWPEPLREVDHHKQKIEGYRANIEGNSRLLKRELELTRVYTTIYLGAYQDAAAVHMIHLKNGSVAPVEVASIQIDGTYAPDSDPLFVFHDRNDNRIWDDDDVKMGEFVADIATKRLVFEPAKPLRIYNRLAKDFSNLAGQEYLFVSGGSLAKRPLKIHFRLRNVITGKILDNLEAYESISALEQLPQVAGKMVSRRDFLRNHPAFQAVPDSAAILLPKGEHRFNSTIVVPRGVPLLIEAGATVKLGGGVSLLCYDRVEATGRPDGPIRFEPERPDKPYGVVAVVGPFSEKSRFEYVNFTGYSEATVANTFFSGGLSLHSAPADLLHCSFVAGKGEDALNFKNTAGSVVGCLFADNPSDAIDLDWSDVVVADSRFERNRGDGIDLSGTITTIKGNIILASGDKGISLGENSRAVIVNNFIGEGKIGIAAKDLSHGEVLATTVYKNQMAFAAYQKKAIFGGGKLSVAYSIVADNRGQFGVDAWSSIRFENNLLQKRPPGQGGNFIAKPNLERRDDGSWRLANIDEQYRLDETGRAKVSAQGVALPADQVAIGFFGAAATVPGGQR